MNKNKQVINITFDASMDINQVKSAINIIEKGFSGIKLPQNLFNKLTSDLQDLKNELDNFSTLSSNMKNLSDIGKSEKSLEKITILYQKLQKEISEIKGIDINKLIPNNVVKKINQATNAFESYQSAIKEIGKESENTRKRIQQLLDLKNEHRQLASSLTSSRNRLQELEEELPSARTRATTAKTTAKNAIGTENYTKLVEEQERAELQVKKLETEYKNLQKTINTNTVAIQKNEAAQKQYSDITETFGARVRDLRQALDTVGQTKADEALQKLRTELSQIEGLDVTKLKNDLSNFDDLIKGLSDQSIKEIEEAITKISNEAEEAGKNVGNIDNALKSTSDGANEVVRVADEVERLKNQVLDFFSIGNTIQIFKRAITSAFNTVKELDAAMTETAVVTDFSIGDMWDQLPQYTQMANDLGVSILDAYDAATLYYQQGLQTNEVMAVSNETLKMARIASMDAADATDLMTAALRGFNMEVNEMSAQRINDVYSELAAVTAADTEEIGVAMSKTASIAASANMEFETTAALLSQIIETTREAPETAGTAMKTIIARFSEVKELVEQGQLIGTDEEGEEINVNKIQAALKSVGISMNEFFTGTKGLDDILLELASKWDTLDFTTQRYIATTAAGSRQQSRFIAMMSDYGRTQELVSAAYNSTGASQEQFNKTLDSMETKLAKLKNAWDQFTMGLANNEIIKLGIDLLTGLLTTVNSLIEALSGGNGLIQSFLSLGTVIGGLKLGKNIFDKIFGKVGKNSNGFIASLFGGKSKIQKESQQQGETIAKEVSRGFSKNKVDVNSDGFFKKLFTINTNEFTNSLSNDITRALNSGKITNQDAITITTAYKTEGADAAISKAQELGVTISETTEKSKVFAQDTTFNMNAVATAAGAVGLMFAGIGTALENSGNTEAAKVFQTISTILFTISGLLPLISAGAKALGASFTIAGSQAAAAGATAQAGWGWIGGVIALAVFLGSIIGGILSINNNSLEKRMEEAAEQTKAAQEAAEKAQESYDGLLSKREEYNDLHENLSSLTKGTLEWEQALANVNAQVLELIRTYPELAKYISRGKNGELILSDEGWEESSNLAQEAINNSNSMVLGSQLYEGTLQRESLFNRDFEISQYSTLSEKTEYTDLSTELVEKLFDAYVENPSISRNEMNQIIKENFDTSIYKELEGLNITQFEDIIEDFSSIQKDLVAQEIATQNTAEAYLNVRANDEIRNSALSDQLYEVFGARIRENYEEVTTPRIDELLQRENIDDLMEQRNILEDKTGDDLTDLQTIYADMLNISVDEIESSIKDSKTKLARAIANMEYGESIYQGLESFGTRIAEENQKAASNFLAILSNDIGNYNEQEIENLASLNEHSIRGNLSNLALDLDFSNIEELADTLDMSVDELVQTFMDNLDNVNEAIDNQKIGLIESMMTTGAYGNSQDMMTAVEKMTIQQQQYLGSALEKIEPLGQDAQKILLQQMPDIALDAESYKEAQNLIDSINFNNPIDSALALQSAMLSDNVAIQKFATDLNTVGQDAFSTGEQFKYLINSSNFEDTNEQLDEFIQKNGEISASNIEEVAKSNADLNKMLSQGKVSASGLAKALTQVKLGNIDINSLTTRILETVSSVYTLDDALNDMSNTIENFDPGIDSGSGIDFLSNAFETMGEYAENFEYGNTQFQTYFRQVFGPEALQEALNSDDAIAVFNNYLSKLENWISGDGYGFWSQFGNQDNIGGSNLSTRITEAGNVILGSIDESTGQFVDKVALTTEQMIQALMNATGINYDTANMFVQNFRSHSYELAQEINEIDFNEAMKTLFDQGSELNTISEQEIINLSSLFNKTEQQIRDKIDELNNSPEYNDSIKIVNWFDSDGLELLGNELFNSVITQLGVNDADELLIKLGFDTSEANIDIDQLQQALSGIGLTEQQTTSMTNEIVSSINKGVEEGKEKFLSQEIEVPVKTTLENGEEAIVMDTVTVRATSVEGLEAAINSTLEAANYNLVAEKITNNDFSGLATNINDIMSKAAQNSAVNLKTTIDNIIFSRKTLTIDPKLSRNSFDVTINTKTKIDGTNAEGTGPKGFRKDGNSLVGEEGEELVQDENGAYLVGTDGPEVVSLNKGDIVYSNKETEDILQNKSHNKISRYAEGRWPSSTKSSSGSRSGSSSNSSSSGSSSDEEEPWMNPYDWLYNLTEDINENLREREKLERRYDRILRDRTKTAKDLYNNIQAQTENLRVQERLQSEMLSKRQQEMRDYLNENASLSQYGTYNWGDNTIEINWDLINTVTDQDEGERIEEYISKLEEIQDNMDDAEDALDEIIDQIYELQQIGKEEFDDLESRTLDALIQRDQEAIDKLSNINDSINNANQKLLNSIQTNLDQIRQDRQNAQTEQDLSEKERQLAYLRQDTSGANAMQIKQLEEELASEQESYTDTLIDQKISELQQQNDEAAEQRERQIELAQAQLEYAQENGLYWQEAHQLMQDGVNAAGALIHGSELVEILGSAEGWDAMSEIQKMNWLSELEETSKQALQYFSQQRQLETIGKTSGTITFTNANGEVLTGTVQGDGSVVVSGNGGTYTYSGVYQNYDGTYRTLEGSGDASYAAYQPAPSPAPPASSGGDSASYYRATPYRGYSIVDGLKAIGEYEASKYANRKKIAAANGISGYSGTAAQNTQMLRLLQEGRLKKYARGGLVDETGLAWLDGTKSNPELVLRAKDTENFIQLKDILSDVLKGYNKTSISERTGDNYFEVYIEVDSLGSDYDVEQLATKVKKMINDDARYRNVNAINILR